MYQGPWNSLNQGQESKFRLNSHDKQDENPIRFDALQDPAQQMESRNVNVASTGANSQVSTNGFIQQFPTNAMSSQMQSNALMMMNSQAALMGGIIPFNVMMPQGFNLDTSRSIEKPKKRRRKPRDKPKRPLSAYNLYFKDEREKIINQTPRETDLEVNEKITWPGKKRPPHGKISFEELAKTIGSRWKNLDTESKSHYKKKADEDLERYATEMKLYDKRSKQHYKDSESDNENDEVDKKRPKEATKSASTDSAKKKKKQRKYSKDSSNESPTKSKEGMDAVQDNMRNMMAMNVAGNFVFPMMMNPTTGQPMDRLEMLYAQQKIISQQIAQETERRRKMQLERNQDSRKPDFNNAMPRNHHYNQHQSRGAENNHMNQSGPYTGSAPLFMQHSFENYEHPTMHYNQGQSLFEGNMYNVNTQQAQQHPRDPVHTQQAQQHPRDPGANFSLVDNNQNISDFPFPSDPSDLFGQTD